MSAERAVTIVVPVYGDWPSLRDCIESLKKYVDHRVHQVILVNDCGPDVEKMERNIKQAIIGETGFAYYRNPKNLGFVRTCNRAVTELDMTSNDILLLNSDTKVTRGFLEEMLTVLERSPSIGVVSPRSNNATIATIPLSSAAQKGINSQESYKMFKKMQPLMPVHVIVPVAHGFCMLIRRSLIKQYGLFDEVFGKGYGEEVDFCLRIAQHGHRSALSNRAYVFHLEARSFSLETKAKLLEQNNKIIWRRYPNYRQSVRDYMERALQNEGEIELKLGLDNGPKQRSIGNIVRSHPRVYRLAKNLKSKFNK